MPPKKARRQSAAEKWQSFTSSVLPRPTGRPRKDGAGNVSLSSTVGAPTPARSRKAADDSLASTLATSTPAAVPTQRGRPRKHALTTPGSRALTSADTTTIASTSYSVVAPAARPQGRLSKSKLSAPQSRANVSSSNSASFSDQYKRRGRPPKNASDASTSVSQSMPKRRGRPSESVNKLTSTQIGLPRSQSSKAPRYVRPEVEQASGSEVSLIDGASDEDDDASEVDHDQSGEEEEALSSEDEARQASTTRKKSKRKGWPSEIERLRKWRRLSVEERECVTSEGGLIWRTAIPLLNSMPKNIRSMVADSLTRALNRIDGKLESGLVPPLARIPQGTTAASATRRDLASSMLSWRLEEEASLLRAENPAQPVDVMELGLNGDILELEQMLLPEAEHIVELSKTLTHQSEHLEQSSARIAKLKRDRRLIKSTGSTGYPANLEANELLSVTNQSAALDPKLSSFLRLAHRA